MIIVPFLPKSYCFCYTTYNTYSTATVIDHMLISSNNNLPFLFAGWLSPKLGQVCDCAVNTVHREEAHRLTVQSYIWAFSMFVCVYVYVIVCGAGLGGSSACVCVCVCRKVWMSEWMWQMKGGWYGTVPFIKKQERNVKSDQYTAEDLPVPLRPRGTIYENLWQQSNIQRNIICLFFINLKLSRNQVHKVYWSVYSCAILEPNVHYECTQSWMRWFILFLFYPLSIGSFLNMCCTMGIVGITVLFQRHLRGVIIIFYVFCCTLMQLLCLVGHQPTTFISSSQKLVSLSDVLYWLFLHV